jgi:hypothetical protein
LSASEVLFGGAHIVSLDDGNIVYVEVKRTWQTRLPEKIFAIDGKGGLYEGKYDEKDHFVIDNLPDNLSLKLFYLNNRGQAKSIGRVETSYYEDELLPISMPLHRHLKQLVRENEMSLGSIVNHVMNSRFSRVEKASFLQRYVLKGNEEASIDAIFVSSAKEVAETNLKRAKSKCSCERLTVLPEFELEPGDIRNAINDGIIYDELIAHVIASDPSSSTPNFPIIPELEYYVKGAGPAKLMFSYSDGYKRNRNEAFGGIINSSGASGESLPTDTLRPDLSQSITQVVTLFCNGGAQEIPDCACEKDVELSWFYESRVHTRAFRHNTSGTRRALAIGEDLGIAFYIQEPREIREESAPIVVEVVGSAVNRSESSCNADANRDWIGSGATAVAAFAGLIFSFTNDNLSSSMNVNNLRAVLVNQTLTQLGSFIEELDAPLPATDNCNAEVQVTPGAVIPQSTTKFLKLYPNRTLFWGISSGARMVNRGTRSWESEVVISSDFYITAEFPSGKNSGGEVEDCCTATNYAYFWNRTIEAPRPPQVNLPSYTPTLPLAPASDQIELRSKVARAFNSNSGSSLYRFAINGRGDYTVESDYGTYTSTSRTDRDFCKLAVIDTVGGVVGPLPPGIIDNGGGAPSKDWGSHAVPPLSSFRLEHITDMFALASQQEDNFIKASQVSIYDITGRVLGQASLSTFSGLLRKDVSAQEIYNGVFEKISSSPQNLPSGVYILSVNLLTREGEVMKSYKYFNR